MWPINEQMNRDDLDERLKAMLNESWDVCAAMAILNHRSEGRGITFLAYDVELDKIVSFYISRKHLYDTEMRQMFSYAAWQNILKITRDYPMKKCFCLVMADQITD